MTGSSLLIRMLVGGRIAIEIAVLASDRGVDHALHQIGLSVSTSLGLMQGELSGGSSGDQHDGHR